MENQRKQSVSGTATPTGRGQNATNSSSSGGSGGNLAGFDWVIGLGVKVVNTLDVTYEGSIFAYDTITNTLVLASPSSSSPKDGAKPTAQSYNLNFIKISLIKDVTVTKAAPSAQSATPNNSNPPKGPFGLAEPKIGPLNVQTIQSREAAAVRKELQDAAHVGIGVTKEGQEIYDALRKSYQVRWNNKDIIVVDMVVVSEPYTPADCVAVPGKNAALERIKMVLEGEREKLGLQRKSTTPVGEKKGG